MLRQAQHEADWFEKRQNISLVLSLSKDEAAARGQR